MIFTIIWLFMGVGVTWLGIRFTQKSDPLMVYYISDAPALIGSIILWPVTLLSIINKDDKWNKELF